MQTQNPSLSRRFWPKAIGLGVALVLWGALRLIGLPGDWGAGAAIILGFAAMFVAARRLGVSAASLWWWPLNDPSQTPEDESRGHPRP